MVIPASTYKRLQAAGLNVGGGMLRCGDLHWQHGRVVTLNQAKTAPKMAYSNATLGNRSARGAA